MPGVPRCLTCPFMHSRLFSRLLKHVQNIFFFMLLKVTFKFPAATNSVSKGYFNLRRSHVFSMQDLDHIKMYKKDVVVTHLQTNTNNFNKNFSDCTVHIFTRFRLSA